MRTGFTLIELLFVLAFSGVLITTLFTAFFQINRTLLVAENIIDFDTRISIMQNQLQKDVSGVFVPIQALQNQPEKETPSKEEEKKKAVAEKVKQKKVLKDVFLSINKNGLLSELTFITNNVVRVYEFAKNAKVNPRIVRVVYRLVPDKNKKDLYSLMRQEGTDLDFNAYKQGAKNSIRSYVLAIGIKRITVEFKMPKEQEEGSNQNRQSEKKDGPLEFITVKDWRFDQLQKEKKIKIQIPQWVAFKIVLWDNQQEAEREVTFTYNIVGYNAAVDQLKPPTPKPEPEKKKAADEKQKKEKEAQSRLTQRRGLPGQKGRTIVLPSPEEIKVSVQQLISMMNS